jgi:hypothetical protein
MNIMVLVSIVHSLPNANPALKMLKGKDRAATDSR